MKCYVLNQTFTHFPDKLKFSLIFLLNQTRDVNRRDAKKVREANMYIFIEACIAFLVSFVINVFVVAVFAHGLYGKKNVDIVSFIEMIAYSSVSQFKLIFYTGWYVQCNKQSPIV